MNSESKVESSTPTLKNLIEAAGITQRQLSKDTGIAEVTINTWVAGRKVPRLDNAILLASKLGISLKTLSKAMGIDVSKVPDDIISQTTQSNN
jgi:transcriptional regulator with XRE-family HTH domain